MTPKIYSKSITLVSLDVFSTLHSSYTVVFPVRSTTRKATSPLENGNCLVICSDDGCCPSVFFPRRHQVSVSRGFDVGEDGRSIVFHSPSEGAYP